MCPMKVVHTESGTDQSHTVFDFIAGYACDDDSRADVQWHTQDSLALFMMTLAGGSM